MHTAGLNRLVVALGVFFMLGPSWAWFVPRAHGELSIEQSRGENPAIDLLEFDIPAQPLAAALKQYALVTRQSTMFRSELVAGKNSSALHGRYSAESALRRLLRETDLIAERVDSNPAGAFVLKPKSGSASAMARLAPPPGLSGYPGLLQARVWEALCADPRTEPGEYRALLRLRIDADGSIRQPRLLTPTGDAQRDALLLEQLRQVRLPSPPAKMPQPIALLIEPRSPGSAQSCGGVGPSS